MKILFTDIHHGNGGGHATYIMNLLKGLREQNELTLAAPPSGRLFRLASGVDGIRVLPGVYTSRLLTLLGEVRRLRKFLQHERFDIVHVNGSADHRHVMLACLGWRDRPAIVWTKHNTKRIASVGNRLRAWLGTDAAIGVSEYVTAMLQASPYRGAAVHTIHNSVCCDTFQPVSAIEKTRLRAQWFGPLPDDVLVFGSTGGTDEDKGWLVLVKAISQLPASMKARCRVLVAGDPPPARLIERVAASHLQEQVVFPGLVGDVRTVLGACDIGFVLSYQEAASYAKAESLAMGLPILVSNAQGLPENVRDGIDGWITPTADDAAVAGLLQDILLGKWPLNTMGENARAHALDTLALPLFVEQTSAVYRRLIENRAV